MARSHTGDGVWTNPEVRFERSDVKTGNVLRVGVPILIVLTLASVVAVLVGVWLQETEKKRKVTTLPPAYGEEKATLPPVPLEAQQDLREGKFRPYPPRAREFLEQQAKEKPQEGTEPIDQAMRQLAGQRLGGKRPAPASFAVSLPSKSSSGRVETGGK